MYITHARSSSGTVYPYFFCGGRSKKRTRCTMPATLIPLVESRVEDLYRAISITPAQRLRMEEDLGCRAGSSEPQPETDLSHTAAEVAVKREKILDAYYQDAITLHTLQVELERLATMTKANERAAAANQRSTKHLQDLERIGVRENAYIDYQAATLEQRRTMHQTLFGTIALSRLSRTMIELKPAHTSTAFSA